MLLLVTTVSGESWICDIDKCVSTTDVEDVNELSSWGNWTCDSGVAGNATVEGDVIIINDMDASNPRGCYYELANYTQYFDKHVRFTVELNTSVDQVGRIEMRHEGSPPNTWVTSGCDGKHEWTTCFLEAIIPDNATKLRLKVGGTYVGQELGLRFRNVTFKEMPVENISCPNASQKHITSQALGMPNISDYTILRATAMNNDSWLWGALNYGVIEVEWNFEPLTFDMAIPNANNYTLYTEDMNVALIGSILNEGGTRSEYMLDSGIGDNCIPVLPQMPAGGNAVGTSKALIGFGRNGTNCNYDQSDSIVLNIPALGAGNITWKACQGDHISFIVNRSDSYEINVWSINSDMHVTLDNVVKITKGNDQIHTNITH